MSDLHPDDLLIYVAVIEAEDGTLTVIRIAQSKMHYLLQRYLGEDSTFQVLSSGDRHKVYVDDEGKRKALEINSLATEVWQTLGGRRDDFLCGNAVFVGLPDSEGYDTSIDIQTFVETSQGL